MGGRMFGTEGIKKAEEYIASEFERYGLVPVLEASGDGRSGKDDYFIPVELYSDSWDRTVPLLRVETTVGGPAHEVNFDLENYPLPGTAVSPEDEVFGEIVFAGYGIDAPEYDWNDYVNIDVEGKIVLVFRHEPDDDKPASVFDGTRHTDYATFEYKMKTAGKKGAVGLILFDNPRHWENTGPFSPASEYSDTSAITRPGVGGVPGVHVSAGMIQTLYPAVDFDEIQKAIDEGGAVPDLPSAEGTIILKRSGDNRLVEGRNVVGYIPARGNRRGGIDTEERLIVIGAHHDHIGSLSLGTPGDRIFNGADDNASGVSAVLELAEHFSRKKMPVGLLFVTFSAEELGLFGSKQIFDRLPWLEEKTIGMINLDMIGRNPDDDVMVLHSGLTAIIPTIDPLLPEGYRGIAQTHNKYISDAYMFSGRGIPTVFFFTGEHEDYHRPTDEADLLDYVRMKEVIETAAAIIEVFAEGW